MKKFTAVLSRIISALLIVVLLFAGYVFITAMRAGKDKVPSVFGYSFLKVMTGSMEPTIPTDSMIIVRKQDASEIQVDDIICFYSPDPAILNTPNTHRVTEIHTEDGVLMFTTKGDAGMQDDPYPVSADRIIGVCVHHFEVGKLTNILQSKVFFFFALLIPLCIVIFIEFLHLKNLAAKKEEKHEKES